MSLSLPFKREGQDPEIRPLSKRSINMASSTRSNQLPAPPALVRANIAPDAPFPSGKRSSNLHRSAARHTRSSDASYSARADDIICKDPSQCPFGPVAGLHSVFRHDHPHGKKKAKCADKTFELLQDMERASAEREGEVEGQTRPGSTSKRRQPVVVWMDADTGLKMEPPKEAVRACESYRRTKPEEGETGSPIIFGPYHRSVLETMIQDIPVAPGQAQRGIPGTRASHGPHPPPHQEKQSPEPFFAAGGQTLPHNFVTEQTEAEKRKVTVEMMFHMANYHRQKESNSKQPVVDMQREGAAFALNSQEHFRQAAETARQRLQQQKLLAKKAQEEEELKKEALRRKELQRQEFEQQQQREYQLKLEHDEKWQAEERQKLQQKQAELQRQEEQAKQKQREEYQLQMKQREEYQLLQKQQQQQQQQQDLERRKKASQELKLKQQQRHEALLKSKQELEALQSGVRQREAELMQKQRQEYEFKERQKREEQKRVQLKRQAEYEAKKQQIGASDVSSKPVYNPEQGYADMIEMIKNWQLSATKGIHSISEELGRISATAAKAEEQIERDAVSIKVRLEPETVAKAAEVSKASKASEAEVEADREIPPFSLGSPFSPVIDPRNWSNPGANPSQGMVHRLVKEDDDGQTFDCVSYEDAQDPAEEFIITEPMSCCENGKNCKNCDCQKPPQAGIARALPLEFFDDDFLLI
ncbi:hypothetical protein CNYM01_01661 [Colletotrichum nymphaeae SA-01]|uniref:Uncharacterized protein n=1 Tax=Colletotrichum nymphaeae SA-01 TaxID=1460502 RepID=A0A135TWR8_9PEZI|nr:hypothetical protein CNYM01_01661 [Colletotrichum nymphaeae SA-01]